MDIDNVAAAASRSAQVLMEALLIDINNCKQIIKLKEERNRDLEEVCWLQKKEIEDLNGKVELLVSEMQARDEVDRLKEEERREREEERREREEERLLAIEGELERARAEGAALAVRLSICDIYMCGYT